MHRRPLTALFLITCLLFCSLAYAQQETATITGIVRDASGAVVPKATVTVTNVQTNISVKTETDGEGAYVIPSLRPGEYSVAAESSGFPKMVRTGVTLQVAQVARIDVTLQSGQLTETVEVVGATPLLDTQTSSRGLVIDQKTNRGPAAERPRLQPARPALSRRAAGHSAAGERELQGRAQRQRQPHVQQRVPARRRGQHLVLELLPWRERATRAALDRSPAGVQDPDERLFGGIRPQLGRRRQCHDQVRHEHGERQRLRVPAQRQARRQQLLFERAEMRPSRNASATSSVWRSAARSSATGRSGSATTRGCAIRKACRACAWCRRRRKKPAFSAAVVNDPFAAGRPAFSQNAQGQWVIPRDRWDPVGAAIVALIPDPNVRQLDNLRVDAGHRHHAGSVRHPHRSSVQAQHDVLRAVQLRGHADVPSGAAARPGGRFVQRRVWLQRQPLAGTGARLDLDDVAQSCWGSALRLCAR